MKNILPHIKKILIHSCVCFTGMTLFLFLIGSSVPTFGNAIAVSGILSVYLFSLLLSFANRLLVVQKIKIGWRVLLHYLASAASFYGVFILIAMKITASRSILVGMLLFTILYAFFMGIYLFLYYSVVKESKEQEKHYKSIYK